MRILSISHGGLKYDANGVYRVANSTQTYNLTRFSHFGNTVPYVAYDFANKAQNIEIVAQYPFDVGLRPSLVYLQSRGKNFTNGTGGTHFGNQDLVKFLDMGAIYFFNKNISTYVDYEINLLNDNDFIRTTGINTENIVAVGLVYRF